MDEQAADELVLRDLVPAEPLLPDPGLPAWAWLALALAALLLLGGIFALLRRKKKAAAIDPRAAEAAAYRRACGELDAPPAGGIQTLATHVSITLRRYLAAATGDPALFETHEEFVSRHQALKGLSEEMRTATGEEFSHLARLKYGRDAAGDPEALVSGARQLLDRLHQHQLA